MECDPLSSAELRPSSPRKNGRLKYRPGTPALPAWLALPVAAQGPAAKNLALGQPVAASGLNWGTFSPAPLTDGNPDPDADAHVLPALMECALGTLDNNPASGPAALRPGFAASGAFQFSFTRSLAADDVTVKVQTSHDLSAGSSAQRLSSEPVSAGWVRETWGTPATGRPQAYLRIRVLQP